MVFFRIMELDNFLASPRWEILQLISNKPSSPVEISEKIGTTVSYISQQLKLLEVSGIVKKQRTGAVEKGKPRTIFSISKDVAYIVALTESFSEKKLISLTENKKAIIKIWLIENQNLHPLLERIFWNLEPLLQDITSVYIDLNRLNPKVIIIGDKPSIKPFIESIFKKIKERIDFEFVSSSSKIDFSSLYLIFSDKFSQREIQLKGGGRR
jgi:predicted transcriptional regulator